MPGLILEDIPAVSPNKPGVNIQDWKIPEVATETVEVGLSSDDESFSEQSSEQPSGAVTPAQEERLVAYDGKTPPGPLSTSEICELIVGVLERYRLYSSDDAKKPWGAKSKFLFQVERYVIRNEAVLMALPAFPFKSPNKKTKVLGTLPDKGEEVALSHLHGLCLAIKDVYAPGAAVFIVSDGLMYNGTPD